MAFPSIRSEATGAQTSNTTTHSVALPATVSEGDLLRVAMSFDGNPTVTWDNSTAGTWTLLSAANNGSICKQVNYIKVADGTEGGLTLSVTTSATEQSVYRAVAYTSWGGTLSDVAVSATPATGVSTAPNPPSLTSGFGAVDTLWIEVFTVDNGTRSVTAASANYTNLFSDASGGTAGVVLGSARRELAAATEDPGTATISASDDWIATTIAIRGTNAQTLTPGLFSNSQTFYSHTVTTGPVGLTQSSRFDNSPAFYTHTLAATAALTQSSSLTNSQTFYSHTLTQLGAVGYVSWLQFVAQIQLAQDSTLASSSVIYAPSLVLGPVGLTQGSRLDNAQTFYPATVTPGVVTLTPGLFSNAQTFYSHTVTSGSGLVQSSRLDNTSAFYPAAITTSASLIQSARLDNSSAFYAHSITSGSVGYVSWLEFSPASVGYVSWLEFSPASVGYVSWLQFAPSGVTYTLECDPLTVAISLTDAKEDYGIEVSPLSVSIDLQDASGSQNYVFGVNPLPVTISLQPVTLTYSGQPAAVAAKLEPFPRLPENYHQFQLKVTDLVTRLNARVNGLSEGLIADTYSASNGPPVSGSWQKGDFIANKAPQELGATSSKYVISGWLCIEGGEPGTWVEQRISTGN